MFFRFQQAVALGLRYVYARVILVALYFLFGFYHCVPPFPLAGELVVSRTYGWGERVRKLGVVV